MASDLHLLKSSTIGTRLTWLRAIIGLIVLCLTWAVLQESLQCVDTKGCLKDHCIVGLFGDSYRQLVRDSHVKN